LDLFKHNTKEKTRINDKTPYTYDEALTTGSTIGKIITNIWNSQKNPGKAYILNRRIHHGEIGILLELSNLFKKCRPATAGILSGIGEALSNDDIADKGEWFKFKKKENKRNLKTYTHIPKHLERKLEEAKLKRRIQIKKEVDQILYADDK
jgi:hypothetical protein